MDNKGLIELFEKAYFHELDVREKLISRLQLIFTLHITFFAVVGYMCKVVDYSANTKILASYFIFLIAIIIMLAISVYYAYKALTGFKYLMLPSGTDILKYNNDYLIYTKQIEDYNEKHPECSQKILPLDEHLDNFMMKNYAKISDKNAEINEKRRQYIANSLKWLLKGVLLLIVTWFLFILFDLDLSSPRKPVSICDKNIVLEIKNLNGKLEKLVMRRIAMNKKKTTNDSNSITEVPDPPKEPDVRVSTEDLKPKIEKDTKIITEDQ